MRRVTTLLVAAACAAGLSTGWASPAGANVFALDGQDPRAPSPRTGPDRMLAPVGAIVTDAAVPASDDGTRNIRTRGSAFLVSPCYVLTNYHAVFGLDYDGPDPGRAYGATFYVGADPDYPFRWTVTAKPVRWGAFNKRKEHDWALLKLDACVGGQTDIGWLDLAPEPGPDILGVAVSLAGYPSDKSDRTLWVQPSCRIEAMQEGTDKVLHGCSVRSGASGGPLIAQLQAGPAVVAIQCGELNATADLLGRWDPRYANTAVTIAEVMQDEEVRRLIDEDLAGFHGPNPAHAPDAPLPEVQKAGAQPAEAVQPETAQPAAPPPQPVKDTILAHVAGLP